MHLIIQFLSHRSPTFSKEETKILVNIVDKYKSIVLNKSTSAAASHTKEVTWNTIAKMFNSHGFKHSRSADCLKTKWENLKKEARKLSKNLIDVQYTEFNDLTSQVVTILNEAEKNGNALEHKPSIGGESNGTLFKRMLFQYVIIFSIFSNFFLPINRL